MTKQPDSDIRAARDRPVQIEITPAMIDAGVAFYSQHASHDEFCDLSPRQLVAEVLRHAFSRSTL